MFCFGWKKVEKLRKNPKISIKKQSVFFINFGGGSTGNEILFNGIDGVNKKFASSSRD